MALKPPSEILRYGTAEHQRVLKDVRARYEVSYEKMCTRHNAWKEAEELFRAYVPVTAEDELRKTKRNAGDPQYVTLHIPYSYAVALTIHTYLASVFLSRSPVFQFTGRHGQTQQQTQVVESYIDYQLIVGEMLVPLCYWLLDMLKYGFGVVGNYWEKETRTISRFVTERPSFLGVPIPGTKEETRIEKTSVAGYEGNRLFNVRPHDFFPDPSVALQSFQDGEFCGRTTQASYNSLVARRGLAGYFNLDALKTKDKSSYDDRVASSSQMELPNQPGEKYLPKDKGNFHILEENIHIVPKDWGLSDSEDVEDWVFTIANGSVVIGTAPAGALHGKFPYALQAYEFDPYTFNSRGVMEVLREMNMAMDFLVNQHFFNVRKALNDMFIVDPSRVNMKDLLNGGPGKLIRLQSTAFGTDVRSVLTQMPVTDVTSQNIRDLQILEMIIQRITGATDNVMGMVNQGGRKTATEVRTSTSFGINRLKVLAEFNAALGWGPLAQMMLQNSQQRYSDEMKVKIAGDLLQNSAATVSVTPDAIAGAYDFAPVDGTLPIDRYAQANLWREILFGLSKVPQIGMQYDMAGIFGWMAQLAGLKNITQFKLQMSPDQKIMAALQAGNMVPAKPSSGQPDMPDLSLGPTM